MNRLFSKSERRTADRVRFHYEVEKELAERLLRASKDERRKLYSSLYEELYERVPDHPQLVRKVSSEQQKRAVSGQIALLELFVGRDTTYLEVGPGDCAVVFEIASRVRKAFGVDVSETITASSVAPENFELFLSDGCSIPVPANSVDVAYSNQLMEHLHPDDALEQLGNIRRALRSGGMYLCSTPNALSGPHDISKYFDDVATGFHLKEYTIYELSAILKRVGFTKVKVCLWRRGRLMVFPVFPIILIERLVEMLPAKLRWHVSNSRLIRMMISNPIIAWK